MAAEPVQLNDFTRQWAETGSDVLAAVGEVGSSGWFVLGPQVAAFERMLARVLERAYAIGCGNGMDAIEIGLRALDLKPGQPVLTSPLSAFATTLAIVRAGGVPVFVDVDRHGLLDLDLAEEAFERDAALRFMVPVHLFGHAVDLERLLELRRKFGISIVEDMAQAIGARSGARPVGGCGQLGALSLYPTKNLGAMGDGGAVVTDDPALDRRCRVLRDYGQGAKYEHVELGLNSRLDELHAAILAKAFLPRLAAWNARRAEIAARYDAGICNPGVELLGSPGGSRSVWHLYPVLVPAQRRDHLLEFLRKERILAAVHYPRAIPDQAAMHGTPFTLLTPMPRARELVSREVSLPIHPYLTDREVDRVIQGINAWVSE